LWEKPWLDRFLAFVPPSGSLLDIGCGMGGSLYHASLDPAEYGRLLAVHGFTVECCQPEDPECADHTVWLARYATAGRG
jgi:hypothetical protein